MGEDSEWMGRTPRRTNFPIIPSLRCRATRPGVQTPDPNIRLLQSNHQRSRVNPSDEPLLDAQGDELRRDAGVLAAPYQEGPEKVVTVKLPC